MSLRFNTIASLAAATGLATGFTADAHAQLFTWVNPLGGNWSDAASWSPSIVPNGPGQSAALTGGSYTVEIDQDVALDGLAIAEAIQLDVQAGRTLELGSLGLDSAGTVSIRASETQNSTLQISDNATLRGSGVLALRSGDYRSLLEITEGMTLVNEEGHTIRGDGIIRGSLGNDGTIESSASIWSLRLDGAGTTNNGVIRATPESYAISIDDSGTFDNTHGRIIADGAWVFLSDIDLLTGGTISTESDGLIRFYGNSTIEGITLDGDSQLDDWGTRTFRGTITNNGRMQMDSTSDNRSTETIFSENATLGGVGELILAPSTNPFWHEPADSALFEYGATHGPEHTIRGSGALSGSFLNRGRIVADGTEPLRIKAGDWQTPLTNVGMMIAQPGSVLELAGARERSDLALPISGHFNQLGELGAAIIADDGEIRVPEGNIASIVGGSVIAHGIGRLAIEGALSLDDVELSSPIDLGADGYLGMFNVDVRHPIGFRDGCEVYLLDCDIEHPLVIVPNASLILSRYLSKHREITLAADLHAASSRTQEHPSIGWASGLRLSGNSTIHINGSVEQISQGHPRVLDIGPSRFDAIYPFEPCVLGPGMTISGSGRIGLGLAVEGSITADEPGEHLVLENDYVYSSVYNFGTISATSEDAAEPGTAITLSLFNIFQDIEWCGDDYVDQPPCPPASGVLLADGPNARVVFERDTVVYFGAIRTANGGRIEIPAGSAPGVASLDMDAEVDVRAGGTLYLDSGCAIADDLCLPMELTSNGVITLHDHEAGNSAALFTDHRTILRGSGEIRCGLGSLVGVQLRPWQPGYQYDRWIDFGPDQTLTGSPHILGHFINRGTISVGLDDQESDDARIGAMTADDLLTLTDTSRVHLDLRDADTFESIDSAGTIELGGALHISALDPVALATPTRFPILTAESITGQFDSAYLPEHTGFTWHLFYHPDRVELLATCPADINTTGAAPDSMAWGVPDGALSPEDLTLFVERWLAGTPTADLTTRGTNPGEPQFGTPDGIVSVADLTLFVEQWIAGCP